MSRSSIFDSPSAPPPALRPMNGEGVLHFQLLFAIRCLFNWRCCQTIHKEKKEFHINGAPGGVDIDRSLTQGLYRHPPDMDRSPTGRDRSLTDFRKHQ